MDTTSMYLFPYVAALGLLLWIAFGIFGKKRPTKGAIVRIVSTSLFILLMSVFLNFVNAGTLSSIHFVGIEWFLFVLLLIMGNRAAALDRLEPAFVKRRDEALRPLRRQVIETPGKIEESKMIH